MFDGNDFRVAVEADIISANADNLRLPANCKDIVSTTGIAIPVIGLVTPGIVLLTGGWKTARRALLVFLPRTGIAVRSFPPEPA